MIVHLSVIWTFRCPSVQTDKTLSICPFSLEFTRLYPPSDCPFGHVEVLGSFRCGHGLGHIDNNDGRKDMVSSESKRTWVNDLTR